MIRNLSAAAFALMLAAAPATAQTPACGGTGARCITVSFSEVPLRDVAAVFAEFSGHSIVLGQGITGQVTADVRAQPWDVALQAILESQGLGVRQVAPGMLRIDALDQLASYQQAAPLVTHVFRLNYVPAADVAKTLEAVKTERGSIAVSESTNSLVVTDTEEAVARMAQLIGHP